MTEELARFLAVLREKGVPAATRLRPGRNRADVLAIASSLGLAFGDDLVAWFEWCDGAEFDRAVRDSDLVVPGHAPLRLERAASSYQDIVRVLIDESLRPVEAARRWFPFAAAMHGDLVAAECAGTPTSRVVQIRFEAEQQHVVLADSIAELVDRWTAAYQDGTFAVRPGGELTAPPGASPSAR